MSKGAFIGLGVAVLAGFFAVGFGVYRPRIERDLVLRTQKALEQRSFEVQDTRFSGRDGSVRIRQAEGRGVSEAAQVAGSVYGVRVARVVADEERNAEPSLRVERIGENILVAGVLPTLEVQKSFRETMEQAFVGMTIKDESQVSEVVRTPPYLLGVRPMVGLLSSIAPNGLLELSERRVLLRGEVAEVTTLNRVSERARALLPKGLSLDLALTAPPTVSQDAVEVTELSLPIFRFGFDSVELTSETASLVAPFIAQAKQSQATWRVIGHADAVGTDAYNWKLSQRRAERVADLLASEGLPRPETDWKGEREPEANNGTAEGRAFNRRAQLQKVEGLVRK